MKLRKLENGITLIALVITIVILIILAAITINIALGDGGLIDRAQLAGELTTNATHDEEKALNTVAGILSGMVTGTGINPEPTGPKAEVSIDIIEGTDKVTIKVTATEGETGIESIKLINQEDTREYEEGNTETEENFDVYENGEYTIEVTTNGGQVTTETVEVTTIVADPVARVGGTDYNTLTEAIEAVPNGQNTTIELLRNYNQTVVAEIPAGKDVVIDLKNYTMTLTTGSIRNLGKLELSSSDSAQAGKVDIQNANYLGIYNKGGELQISSGSYITSVPTNGIENTGKMVITGGSVQGNTQVVEGQVYPAIWNSTNSQLDINGGTVNSGVGVGIMNSDKATTTIDGGTITGTGCAIQNNETGIINIKSGKVEATGANTIGNFGAGSINVTGGEVVGATSGNTQGQSFPTIYNTVGNININGGTVSTTTSLAIYNWQNGNVTVDGGTVTSTNAAAILNVADGTVSVNSGTVSSSEREAIQNDAGGTITIDGGTVSTVTGYAIYNRANGNVYVKSGNVNSTEYVTIQNDAQGSITIQGGTVQSTSGTTIVNEGTGNVNISNGTVQATGFHTINNQSTGTINVTGGTIAGATQAPAEGSPYYITILNGSTGTVNANGGEINAPTGVALYNASTGSIIIDGATVTSSGTVGAFNTDNGTITIKSGAINVTSCIALQNGLNGGTLTGNVNIEGGSVTSESAYAIANLSQGDANISNGLVQSISNFTIVNFDTGKIKITGGNVKGATQIAAGQEQPNPTIVTFGTGDIIIEGGTIESTQLISLIFNQGNATVTIGKDDGAVSTTSPVLKTESGCVAVQWGTVNYYDGILIGCVLTPDYATINTPAGWTYTIDTNKSPYETILTQN